MKINGNSLARQLHGSPAPLYWVAGDETLLAQEAADSIRRYCVEQGFSEREVWHIDATTDWQAILLSANSLSLFSGRKLLELRFPSGKPGDKALKPLAQYMENHNPDTVVLACSPKVDAAATRSRAFKQLEPTMLWVQIWPVERAQLPQWIDARLKERGYRATRDGLQLLAERVEGNLLAAQQEIDKLALLVPPEESIDAQAVARSVADSARFDVFSLGEQLLLGDQNAVHRIIYGLRGEGVEAPVLLWAITRELRRLVSIRQAMDKGQRPELAMDQLRIWKKQQGPYKMAAGRLSTGELTAALIAARGIDESIKGRGLVSPWEQLVSLGLAICGKPLFSALV